MRKRIGVIVNPFAGIGGKIGLKGSDAPDTWIKAQKVGGKKEAPIRTIQALEMLSPLKDNIHVITCPGEMGETELRDAGFIPEVIVLNNYNLECTSAEETKKAANLMVNMGVDLLMFVGGDGTARDIYTAVGSDFPVIGVPAGVKIHSPVYAINPRNAGEAAIMFLRGLAPLKEAEVIDIDEEALRAGKVKAKLYGYLSVPEAKKQMQGIKKGSVSNENAGDIAAEVISQLEQDVIYIIGPGTTTRSIMEKLEIPNTLLGVDVILNGQLIGSDVNEIGLQEIIHTLNRKVKIIVTPIGGQGHIFGRGNQQISPRIIEMAGRDGIIVVSAKSKLFSLPTFSLFVDTGDDLLNQKLCGYLKVITGYKDYIICPVKS